jgi:hypothetical protein
MRWAGIGSLFLALSLLDLVGGQGIAQSQAQELLVCIEGPPQCQYTSIQEAIDAAPEGATIRVSPGTCVETLKIKKSLRLIGAGEDKVTLTLEVSEPEAVEDRIPQIEIATTNELIQVWIEGLTLKAPSLPPYPWVRILFPGFLIFSPSGQIALRHLTVTGYGDSIHGGGTFWILDQVTITRNIQGLSVNSRGGIEIRDSQITDNELEGIEGYGFVIKRV